MTVVPQFGSGQMAGQDCYSVEVLLHAFVYDMIAMFAVFVLSFVKGNSSCYDPYWSVAPIPIAFYYVLSSERAANGYRQAIVLVLVTSWGARLTYNWAVGFFGKTGPTFGHGEDWR